MAEVMTTDFKRIPYGISNFKQLRREGKYFVDKSSPLVVQIKGYTCLRIEEIS
ncbi:MAG: hypothetical protein IJ588_14585 [Prevotella sp.]|nr:hypothetical protein [Prevotella sp.]MBR1449953.1 hypothetical protein [Prevotella sp.]